MTVAHLEVVARSTPELLERVCRVLRHRGATLEHLVLTTTTTIASTEGAPRTRIDLRARLRNPDADLIVRQLARLPDVHLARRRDEDCS